MEWITDPNAWFGLATLIVLEIVLGIDNLVFIAILADKLPPHQREKARLIGLSLALVMRFVLLASISWIVTLTAPLFHVGDWPFSGRDVILIGGGAFLIAKGTMELHERLEGDHSGAGKRPGQRAVFWQVIAQIIVLDAVFSLDSVITAVGMVEHLTVMFIAVTVAIGVMMLASRPLMDFVSRHPTVVILCLGFLLMIGFLLVVEGFGFYVPKGYLYAAIGFSILIEAANQFARRNKARLVTTNDLRERTSGAVLRLLGGARAEAPLSETIDAIADKVTVSDVFHPEEKEMIRGVLDLAERPLRTIMSPRNEVEWLDLDCAPEEMREDILALTHSRVVLARGQVDDFLGVALVKDILHALAAGGEVDWHELTRQPVVLHESLNVLRAMDELRRAPIQMAVVVDEHGSFEGVATPTDVLEAIAGEFPDEDEDMPLSERGENGSWVVDGYVDIRRLSGMIDRDLVDDEDAYSTLAGYLLARLGHLPVEGEHLVADDMEFEILEMDGRSIARVRITPVSSAAA